MLVRPAGEDLSAGLERAFKSTVLSDDGTVPLRDRDQPWPGSYTAPAPLGSLQAGLAQHAGSQFSQADLEDRLRAHQTQSSRPHQLGNGFTLGAGDDEDMDDEPSGSDAASSHNQVNGAVGGDDEESAHDSSQPSTSGHGSGIFRTVAGFHSGHGSEHSPEPRETASGAPTSGHGTPQHHSPQSQSPAPPDRRSSAGIHVPSPKFSIPVMHVPSLAGGAGRAGRGMPGAIAGSGVAFGSTVVPFMDVTENSLSRVSSSGKNEWQSDLEASEDMWSQMSLGSNAAPGAHRRGGGSAAGSRGRGRSAGLGGRR